MDDRAGFYNHCELACLVYLLPWIWPNDIETLKFNIKNKQTVMSTYRYLHDLETWLKLNSQTQKSHLARENDPWAHKLLGIWWEIFEQRGQVSNSNAVCTASFSYSSGEFLRVKFPFVDWENRVWIWVYKKIFLFPKTILFFSPVLIINKVTWSFINLGYRPRVWEMVENRGAFKGHDM